jgi:hypothetical protein
MYRILNDIEIITPIHGVKQLLNNFLLTLQLEEKWSKNQLNSTANYTVMQLRCWPLEYETFLPWLDPVRGKKERKRGLRFANALHKRAAMIIPPPPPTFRCSNSHLTIKLQMEAKFKPTLTSVSVTCVSRGFPRNFQSNWKGRPIVTDA